MCYCAVGVRVTQDLVWLYESVMTRVAEDGHKNKLQSLLVWCMAAPRNPASRQLAASNASPIARNGPSRNDSTQAAPSVPFYYVIEEVINGGL